MPRRVFAVAAGRCAILEGNGWLALLWNDNMALAGGSDIDTGFDPGFETRWWTFMRIVWCAMAVFIAAGLAGALGRGPLSRAVAQAPSVRVEYERVLRFRTPTLVGVRWSPPADHELSLRVQGSCLRALRVERVVPEPKATAPVADGMWLQFDAPTAESPVDVALALEPGQLGRARCVIEPDGSEPVTITQLVLP
jgi:hypothetical protein